LFGSPESQQTRSRSMMSRIDAFASNAFVQADLP
jgi:hypothetical protein